MKNWEEYDSKEVEKVPFLSVSNFAYGSFRKFTERWLISARFTESMRFPCLGINYPAGKRNARNTERNI